MDSFATARLRATRLSPEDLEDLVALHLDPEVSRFLGGVRDRETTAAYLAVNLRHWDDHGFGLFALRDHDGAYVGRAGLRSLDLDGVRELEIAYSLVRRAWGRGLASEIAIALVVLWRARFTQPRLVGVVMKGNTASEGVLLKAGFVHARDTLLHGVPAGVFSLSRDPDPLDTSR
jgi:RimJ/RimL family protein N-acetyltransferase